MRTDGGSLELGERILRAAVLRTALDVGLVERCQHVRDAHKNHRRNVRLFCWCDVCHGIPRIPEK